MAKALMIQGTGSGAGKSLIVAALCRMFNDMGINVTPFKAQNMALNSYVTPDGGEIGRAQVLQAEAARVKPTVDINPVLLKASGEMGSQVIIHGKVHSNMTVKEYYAFKKVAWDAVKTSFDRLSEKHELVIIEGAGSPAEINLKHGDIVNMAVARYAKAPVILIGDIDKGGVFASLYGTVKLLGRDSRYIKAFIINKFRGDMDILRPGLEMIREKTNKPVIGVLPYILNLWLPEEDGLVLQQRSAVGNHPSAEKAIKIVVVKLNHISNFTDFDPFLFEPGVEVVFSQDPAEIENADMVIVPGSKNTIRDLMFLRELHLDESIKRAYSRGIQIIGICGGYQILGKKIFDPYKVESSHTEIEGIGLLNIETTFEPLKCTYQVEAEIVPGSELIPPHPPLVKGGQGDLSAFRIPHLLRGYEIHMGESRGEIGLFRLKRICSSLPGIQQPAFVFDGSINKNCWGTYMHGIFDNDSFRASVINEIRVQKGLPPLNSMLSYSEIRDTSLNRLANAVKENIDMDYIKKVIGLC